MLKAIPQEIYEVAASNGLDEETVEELCQAYLDEFKTFPVSFGKLLEVLE